MTDLRRQTQSDTTHGNCWQTAVACVLELPADKLPSQVAIEQNDGSYHNALQVYLIKHHGLMYSELYDWQYTGVRVVDPGWHMLVGPTVRTPHNKQHHVVVARYGAMVWDPHPSRAGLADAEKWGILSPITDKIRNSKWADRLEHCACPESVKIVTSNCVAR